MPEPRRRRPGFPPSYGIDSSADGLLTWEWAAERLVTARNYWIGSAHPKRGPHAAPVWGLWLDDGLVFSTARESRKGRNLARDPRIVVHLESGDEVVIIEGEVEEISIDGALADAYGAKYAFRPDPDADGLWYRLAPRRAYAWLEQDYPRTATRFDFD